MGNACTCQETLDEEQFQELDQLEKHDYKVAMEGKNFEYYNLNESKLTKD